MALLGCPTSDERWVGTGRVVFDNKGNAIKKYEPFFWDPLTSTMRPTSSEWGATPLLHYDPLGRLSAPISPTGHLQGRLQCLVPGKLGRKRHRSGERVVRQAWQSPPPLTRSHGLPGGHRPGDTPRGIGEARRVARNETCRDTGRSRFWIRLLASFSVSLTTALSGRRHHRPEARDAARARYRREPKVCHRCARSGGLAAGLRRHPATFSTRAHPTRVSAGRCLTLVISRALLGQSQAGFAARRRAAEADARLGLFERQGRALVQRTLYGDMAGAPGESKNLRGNVYREYDGAGLVTNADYDFKGNVTESIRKLTRGYQNVPDWSALAPPGMTAGEIAAIAVPMLQPEEAFTLRTCYDALNRVVSRLTPDGSETLPFYNESNLLERLEVRLRGATAATAFVENVDYNERGQRTLVNYSNGTRTEYDYQQDTFRLTQLRTFRGTNGRLQDLAYTYDPVGNITEIRDAAQQMVFFDGDVVEAKSRYRYDAVYQLIQAEGREHPGQQPTHQDVPRSAIPHPNDGQALRRFKERYLYDAVGNIEKMAHEAGTSGWTRYYAYESDADCNPLSNRLLCTSATGDLILSDSPHCASETTRPYSARYEHDAHGNMISLPHLAEMRGTLPTVSLELIWAGVAMPSTATTRRANASARS